MKSTLYIHKAFLRLQTYKSLNLEEIYMVEYIGFREIEHR